MHMEAKTIMAKTNKVATVHHYKKYTTLEALKQPSSIVPSSIVYCSKEKYLHLTVLPVIELTVGYHAIFLIGMKQIIAKSQIQLNTSRQPMHSII